MTWRALGAMSVLGTALLVAMALLNVSLYGTPWPTR